MANNDDVGLADSKIIVFDLQVTEGGVDGVIFSFTALVVD